MLTPAEVESLLNRWPIGHLATIAPDGAPAVVPIVFVYVGHAIWSPVDGKPKATTNLQRLKNVAQNPRCSLLLDRYTNRWEELWWLRFDCLAQVCTPESGDPTSAAVEAALRAKYPQYREVAPLREPVRLLRLDPLSHAVWSAQPVDWARQGLSD